MYSNIRKSKVGYVYFRCRFEGNDFLDKPLNCCYDVIVVSNIDLGEGYRCRGIGAEIIRQLGEKFPDSLLFSRARKWKALENGTLIDWRACFLFAC